jgi:hypothetical protein
MARRPPLFKRIRERIEELVSLLWLAGQLVRIGRSPFAAPSLGRGRTRTGA